MQNEQHHSHNEELKRLGIERYRLIGDLKQFWRGSDDSMHEYVDLDGLAKFIHKREVAFQRFRVLDLDRAAVAIAFDDEDGDEPDWPYALTDSQMQALADEVQRHLTSETNVFLDAVRNFADNLSPRSLDHLPKPDTPEVAAASCCFAVARRSAGNDGANT